MLMLTKNSVLEMFTAIHQLYANLQSTSDKELGIEPVGHALMIQDNPLRTTLFFQVDNNGVVIQKYAHADEDECLLEKKLFDMSDMAGVENYITASFEL